MVTSCRMRERTLWYLQAPPLWPTWPFLPLVRDGAEGRELGLVLDARGLCGRMGYSATVFHANLFLLPPTLEAFFDLPREVYDSAEELVAAGWRLD